jgi:integrase
MAAGKLSSLKAKALTRPGRYGDGGNLWLQVRDADHRSWLFRYVAADGRQRQMGLGPYPDVGLAEARESARECRSMVRKGQDPIDDRREAKAAKRAAAQAMTFREVADRYLAAHEAAWGNAEHRRQWRQTLDTACLSIGKLSVAAIGTNDVMRVLEPLWATQTVTATRLRGRLESVMDFATTHGWRTGENPARWRGHLANLLPAPKRIAKVEHHAALRWQEMPTFLASLRTDTGVAARALEFLILTAARTGEVLGATWQEIDLQAAVWTLPAARMKAGAEHRVPLSGAAMDVLAAVAPLRTKGDYLFPGMRPGKPLGDRAMLRSMGGGGTVHGFRSTFRDWAAEATDTPNHVVEQALAHAISNAVEAAYRRGDLLEKRRELMADWADYVCGVSSGHRHGAAASKAATEATTAGATSPMPGAA